MKKILSCFVLFLYANVLWSMTAEDRAAYLQWMKQNLLEVPEWTAWQQKTGELPPDFDQLPRQNQLPDPLTFLNGKPVGSSAADWNARRTEIRQLFEKYVTGTFPQKPPIDKVELINETKENGYITRNVRLIFGPQGKGSVRVCLVIPDAKNGEKLPVMISPNLTGWASSLIRRGYISAGYAGNDGMDDAAILKDLYPDYDFATLPRRAWLAQIVIDYLATLPQVDMRYIAINGYSRDGKMATIAAAFDERITALVAGSTGVGGVVPWRFAGERGGGEGIESTTRMFPGWFIPRFRFFSGREDRLPVDANLFLALIAPRAALLEWGLSDQVANGWAMEQAYFSAQKVYERLGQPERMSLLHVPGFHGSNDIEACLDFLDIQFGRSSEKWSYDFIFPWNYNKWLSTSGEKIDINKYPKHNPAAKMTSTRAEWNTKAAELRKSVEWMLGERPPVLTSPPATVPARRSGMGGRPTPGPTEVAKGNAGNPGQLAPDVPAWVIAAGGQEYGWLAPEKEQVTSRRIRFGAGNVTGDLYYLANTPEGKKLPTVIWLHGYHYPLGYMWVYRRDLHPILALAKAGYAVLAYDQTGHGMRWNESAPFYNRWPHWSRLGKMVEDVRGAVDALQKDAVVDPGNISLFGYTMGGTIGLYAAALDERIAGVVSVAGFTPMRTDTPDRGTSGMTRHSQVYGMVPRLGLFAGNESRLPYDYEDLIALIAPRPVLIIQPAMDRDATPTDVKAAIDRAKTVYTLNGAANNLELQEPNDYARLTAATQNKAIEWMKANIKNLK